MKESELNQERYPWRLMQVLKKVLDHEKFTLDVIADDLFSVYYEDCTDESWPLGEKSWMLGYHWDQMEAQEYLERLELKFEDLEAEEAEEKRLEEVRYRALGKLTKEERDALGLMDNRLKRK